MMEAILLKGARVVDPSPVSYTHLIIQVLPAGGHGGGIGAVAYQRQRHQRQQLVKEVERFVVGRQRNAQRHACLLYTSFP